MPVTRAMDPIMFRRILAAIAEVKESTEESLKAISTDVKDSLADWRESTKAALAEVKESTDAAMTRRTKLKSSEKEMDSQFKENKKIEEPRREILMVDGEVEAGKESNVDEDSCEEKPEEKNGEESIEKKVEKGETGPENGVSEEKEVEREEPVEEEKKENEMESETAKDGAAKRNVEETEESETRQSPVQQAEDKKCTWGSIPKVFSRGIEEKPLDPELFEEQRISGSPKESPNVNGKSYLQMVCILHETCSGPMQHWWAATVPGRLDSLVDLPRKKMILTYDPGL